MTIGGVVTLLAAVYILVNVATALPFGVSRYRGDAYAPQGGVLVTIDDMPSEQLDVMLDLLRDFDEQAVFFINGSKKPSSRDVELIKKDGHTLGNHSYSHYFFNPLFTDVLSGDLELNEEKIKEAGGEFDYVRTPHGYRTPGLMRYLEKRGLKFMYWDMIIPDFLPLPQGLYRRMIDRFVERGGGVICLHGRKRSVKVLEYLLGKMKG